MKVLVTRAEAPAHVTAGKLAHAGHEAILLPLIAYRATGDPIPDGAFDGIVLTSAAAAGALGARISRESRLASLKKLPTFCVGTATAEAARATGFEKIEIGAGDAAQLADLLAKRLGERAVGARLLYPAARDRAFDLKTALAPLGVAVEVVVIYAADLIDPGAKRLEEALAACAHGAALLYSARTAAHLFALADRHGMADDLAGLTFLAISENVAKTVSERHDRKVRVAGQPDEDALLSLLDRPNGCNEDDGDSRRFSRE